MIAVAVEFGVVGTEGLPRAAGGLLVREELKPGDQVCVGGTDHGGHQCLHRYRSGVDVEVGTGGVTGEVPSVVRLLCVHSSEARGHWHNAAACSCLNPNTRDEHHITGVNREFHGLEREWRIRVPEAHVGVLERSTHVASTRVPVGP